MSFRPLFARRPRTGIVCFLVLVVMLPELLFVRRASAGIDTGDAQTKLSTSGQPSVETDTLLAKAEAAGSVRVIIGLTSTAVSGPDDLRVQKTAVQGSDIAKAQDDVLESLDDPDASATVRKFDSIPYMALNADTQAIEALRSMPEVSSIQEDRLLVPSLAESIPLIRADLAWAGGFSGEGQAVAILDTGVDYTHPFLSGKMLAEACFSNADGFGTSTCPNGLSVDISAGSGLNCRADIGACSHGTHVAGIAIGNGTYSGVAKDSDLVSIQVFTEFSGSIGAWTSDLILGLEHVLALYEAGIPIAVVNMSLGGGKYDTYCDAEEPATKAVIDHLREHGIATVVASGNDFYWGSISFPACLSSVISVGASDDLDSVAAFSNSSAMVDLLAPGVSIRSSIPGGGWATWNGTSMATPHVSGAFALLKSRNPQATVDQIEQALESTGIPVSETWNGETLIKPRIDAAAALTQFPAAPTSVMVFPQGGTIVASTLNSTNSFLTAQAAIIAGQSTGGSAILVLGETVLASDLYISAQDTSVTFSTSDGSPSPSELQALIPTGGVIRVRLYDSAGNAAVSSQGDPLLIVDYGAPIITFHADIAKEASSAAGAVVFYSPPNATDTEAGSLAVTCAPISGSLFQVGDTAVSCVSNDPAGNSAVPAVFTVHVRDTMAPVIAPHGPVTAEALSDAGMLVTYLPPGTTDAVDGNRDADCLPVPGALFRPGETTVTCSRTDAAGNPAAPTSFIVLVTVNPVVHPSGTLVKINGNVDVWYLDAGEKNLFNTETEFLSHGFGWGQIITITPQELDVYPIGTPILIQSGTIIKEAADPRVYLVQGAQIHHFPDPAIFIGLGYSWAAIRTTEPGETAGYALGSPMVQSATHYPSTRVKTVDDPAVYLLEQAGGTLQKRWVVSPGAYFSWGWQWPEVITITQMEMDGYIRGADLAYRDGMLVQGAGSDAVYVMEGQRKRRFLTAQRFEEMGYGWGNIIVIPAGECNAISAGRNM